MFGRSWDGFLERFEVLNGVALSGKTDHGLLGHDGLKVFAKIISVKMGRTLNCLEDSELKKVRCGHGFYNLQDQVSLVNHSEDGTNLSDAGHVISMIKALLKAM